MEPNIHNNVFPLSCFAIVFALKLFAVITNPTKRCIGQADFLVPTLTIKAQNSENVKQC